MFVLNIGCGGSAEFLNSFEIWGNVNIDIRKPIKRIENFVQSDVYSLPFPDNFFDKVLFLEVLEHLDKPSQALTEIKRVLRCGGMLISSTPNAQFILKTLQAIKRGYTIVHKDHIALWSKTELFQLLRSCGYKDIKINFSNYRGQHTKIKAIEKFFLYTSFFDAIKNRNLVAFAVKP